MVLKHKLQDLMIRLIDFKEKEMVLEFQISNQESQTYLQDSTTLIHKLILLKFKLHLNKQEFWDFRNKSKIIRDKTIIKEIKSWKTKLDLQK